jgi:hypothetical protein
MEKNTTESVPTPEKSYDEKKLEAFYRELQPYAKYKAMAKNRDDLGEDLAQQFVVTWLEIQAKEGLKFHSLEPPEQIFYLKTVIRNRLSAMLKTEGRFIYDDAAETIPDEAYEPYRRMVAASEQRVETILWKLAEEVLTQNQLDIFELRMRERSFKAIAEATGRTEEACKQSWNKKIIPKLRRALKEKGLME